MCELKITIETVPKKHDIFSNNNTWQWTDICFGTNDQGKLRIRVMIINNTDSICVFAKN